jgi:competence protein ComEC
LSFGIVAGIVLLHRPVRSWLFGRWIRRRGLMVFRADHRLRRWLSYRLGNGLMDTVTVSVTAFLASVPLVAYHFGLFSPAGPVLTVLVLPLLVAVLVPGYLSLALAWPMPNLSALLGAASAGAAGLFERSVDLLCGARGLSMTLQPVSVAWVLGGYVVLALLVLRRRWHLGWAIPAVAVGVLVVGTLASQQPAKPPRGAQLDLLAVGAGQCAVLQTASGKTCLLDVGSASGIDVAGGVLEPFLRHQKMPPPEAVLISHANTDHFSHLPEVLAGGSVRRVFLNDYFGTSPSPPEPVSAVLDAIDEAGAQIVRLRAGETIQLDEQTTLEVLWPPVERRDDLSVNDTSLVVRLEADGASLLLAGDLDQAGQEALLAQPEQLACDVLVIPHHGGWETSLPEFVAAANPKVVLVSAAAKPRPPAGNARAEAFYGQLHRQYAYYCTARHGWVRVVLHRGQVRVQSLP